VNRLAAPALALLLLVLSPASSLARKPLPNGFRDLKWRAPVARGMKVKKDVSAGDNVAYARPSDAKTWHGAALESITYSYFKGRFCAVTVETDAGQGAKLLKALTAEWGEPEKAAENVYVWKDASETLAFLRTTDLDGPSSRGELFIVCKPLVKESNEAEIERREKAGVR
jgi:hypothetical protein